MNLHLGLGFGLVPLGSLYEALGDSKGYQDHADTAPTEHIHSISVWEVWTELEIPLKLSYTALEQQAC